MSVNNSRQQYIEQYAEAAMEQMRRYGIPASVTLAQGIIESANGQSYLAKNANNHFGVKGTFNGQYMLANDDKANEKFKKYDSVSQSYEDHSKVLMSSRYTKYTQSLAHDDYKGWAAAIKKGGYATASNYVPAIIGVIETQNLQKYDQMVMEQMKREGKQFGTAQNPLSVATSSVQNEGKSTGLNLPVGTYSMPIVRNESLLITSSYGMRKDPTNPSKNQFHTGIDLRARGNDILSTEMNGKVVSVNHNTNTMGGKSVTVEYDHGDAKIQVVYCHLSQINVQKGDTVNAGQKLGVTGNTGTHTTGEHLHFAVKSIDQNNNVTRVDPAAYLAEINVKGNLNQQVYLKNGTEVLSKYTVQGGTSESLANQSANQKQQSETPESWMKKMMMSEGMSGGGEGLLGSLMQLLLMVLMMNMNSEKKTASEKMEAITDAVLNKKIDISSMLPNYKSAELSIKNNGNALLTTDNGKNVIRAELTQQQTSQLSQIIHSDISDDDKRQKIASFVTAVSFSQQAAQNYDQIQSQQQQSQQQQFQIK